MKSSVAFSVLHLKVDLNRSTSILMDQRVSDPNVKPD